MSHFVVTLHMSLTKVLQRHTKKKDHKALQEEWPQKKKKE